MHAPTLSADALHASISNTNITTQHNSAPAYCDIMAVSIFERKRDLVYLVFFVIHLPVMLGKNSSYVPIPFSAPCTADSGYAAKHLNDSFYLSTSSRCLRVQSQHHAKSLPSYPETKIYHEQQIPHEINQMLKTPPAFDLTAYYPLQIKPLWMSSVREWYIATYGDRFFYNPP